MGSYLLPIGFPLPVREIPPVEAVFSNAAGDSRELLVEHRIECSMIGAGNR
jgi:hypothetical protein